MKKFLALLLVAVMAMSLVACGPKETEKQPDPQPSTDDKEVVEQVDTDLFLPADFSDENYKAVTSVKNLSVMLNKADLENSTDIMSWTFGMIGAAAEGNEEELNKLAATPMVAYAEDSIYIVKATEYMAFAGVTDKTVDLTDLTSEKLSEFINEQSNEVSDTENEAAENAENAEPANGGLVANGTSAADYGAKIIKLDTGSLNAGTMDDSLWGTPDAIGDGDEEEESPIADIPTNPEFNQPAASGNDTASKPADTNTPAKSDTGKNDTTKNDTPAGDTAKNDTATSGTGSDTTTTEETPENLDTINVGNIVAKNDEKIIFEIDMASAGMNIDAENDEVHNYKGYGAIITKDGKTAYAVMLCDQTAGVSVDNAMQFVKSLNIDLSIPGATAEELDKLNGLDKWADTEGEAGSNEATKSEDTAG